MVNSFLLLKGGELFWVLGGHLQSVGDVVEALLQVLHGPVGGAPVAVLDNRPPQVVLERQLDKVVRLQLRPRHVTSRHVRI